MLHKLQSAVRKKSYEGWTFLCCLHIWVGIVLSWYVSLVLLHTSWLTTSGQLCVNFCSHRSMKYGKLFNSSLVIKKSFFHLMAPACSLQNSFIVLIYICMQWPQSIRTCVTYINTLYVYGGRLQYERLRNLVGSEIWSCTCVFRTSLLPSTATCTSWN